MERSIMEQHYAGYELHIISTVGAQASLKVYKQGIEVYTLGGLLL